MNVLSFARLVAHSEGFRPVRTVDLEYAIWERTGYPAFWRTDNWVLELEAQLRREFRRWAKQRQTAPKEGRCCREGD